MRFLLLALALPLVACTAKTTPPDAPKPPARRGHGEPGFRLLPGKGRGTGPNSSPQGGPHRSARLPSGEVIDEWTLYRRDHPQPAR